MLSALFSGMHRYTRVAEYANRKKMKQTVRANRPGSVDFSFTGEFPEAEDWTPVEAIGRRRSYTQPAYATGIDDAVGTEDVGRQSIFSEHGVRLGAAVAMLMVLAVSLCLIWVSAYAQNAAVAKRLSQQEVRMETLTEEAAILRGEIATRSSGVNVRQEAIRIGLKSANGISAEYVQVPSDAVIDPSSYGLRRDMASVFGQ